MFGERLKLITMQCCLCKKWTAMRVDPEDLERHRKGIYVQRAFVDRKGKPYLSPAEREIFPACSGVCASCYTLLCPSDPLAYN